MAIIESVPLSGGGCKVAEGVGLQGTWIELRRSHCQVMGPQ